jgi:hypothetical protein
VSLGSTKTEFIIWFILGVLGVVLGVGLILLQFFNTGYVIDFSPPDPYGFFVGWAAMGFVALVVGAIAIFGTYKVFMPLKENISPTIQVCPHCGAIVDDEAVVCEKCKQQINSPIK